MAHRYFVPQIEGDTARITGEGAAHLVRVLRSKAGDTLTLFDGSGTDYEAQVLSVAPDEVVLRVLARRPAATEPSLALTLYVGCPKGDRLEHVIQKGVELGAARIVPVWCTRCVAKPKNEEQKNQRYNRIAKEAAQQAARGILPDVALPMAFSAAAGAATNHELALILHEGGGAPLRSAYTGQTDVALFTGPEGGFAPQELAAAVGQGWQAIWLGPRILRCETAPLAAAAALMALSGNLE